MSINTRMGRLYAYPIKENKIKYFNIVNALFIKDKAVKTQKIKGVSMTKKLDYWNVRLSRAR